MYEKALDVREVAFPHSKVTLLAANWDKTLVEVPVTENNYLILGRPGYGKTVFTRALVDGRIKANPNTFCVFFQTKPRDFTSYFLTKNDKVIIAVDNGNFSPEQHFKWNLLEELKQASTPFLEVEEMATIFFAELLEDKKNIVFANAAKELLKAYLHTVLMLGHKMSNRDMVHHMLDDDYDRLFKFLYLYPPNRIMLKNNFSYDVSNFKNEKPYQITKKGQDILFFYTDVLRKFQANFLNDSGSDTIQGYLSGEYGKNLFFLYDYRYKSTCKTFFSYFMKKIIVERLSLSGNYKDPIVLVLDEIDKLQADIGILDALNLGREYKLTATISLQSAESLFLFSQERQSEHSTQAALSGFGTIVAFSLGDGKTRDLVKQIFGEVKKKTIVLPISRYEKPIETVTSEPLVSDSDFSALDVGEFYIKIGSANPKRLKLKLGG